MASKFLISIVDDDEPCRLAMAGLVKSLGFAVEHFSSARDFLASPCLANTSCVIADIQMPGMDGIELHTYLVSSGLSIPTILITAYPDDVARRQALAAGVICYLGKPCDDDSLLACVQRALMRAESPW